jgi:hypothetical protein
MLYALLVLLQPLSHPECAQAIHNSRLEEEDWYNDSHSSVSSLLGINRGIQSWQG